MVFKVIDEVLAYMTKQTLVTTCAAVHGSLQKVKIQFRRINVFSRHLKFMKLLRTEMYIDPKKPDHKLRAVTSLHLHRF